MIKQLTILSILLAACYAGFGDKCVQLHNNYRRPLGLPDLVWSDTLASRSQVWANYLAANNAFYHGNQEGVGENIAKRTTGSGGLEALMEQWGNEARFFIRNGVFPDVSTTGNWDDVSHYTQMVWKNTKEVGCALTTGFGTDFLVCQYSIPGNWRGEKCY